MFFLFFCFLCSMTCFTAGYCSSVSEFEACDYQSGVRCAGAQPASRQLQPVLQSGLFKGTRCQVVLGLSRVVLFSLGSWKSWKGTCGIETRSRVIRIPAKHKQKIKFCWLYSDCKGHWVLISLLRVTWGQAEGWSSQCGAKSPVIPPDFPETRTPPPPVEILPSA